MDIVQVDSVTKIYDSGNSQTTAIEDVDLTIEDGEFCTIVGASGCGKTTLLHMLGGLLEPTEGSIRIKDAEVTEPTEEVNMVFQDYVLLEWRTVLENLLLPVEAAPGMDPDDYVEKAESLLETAGIHSFKDSYPHELSGGMKQRVSFLMALMTEPEVVLLDEPFGALDVLTREKMNEEMLRVWNAIGTTAVLVTHDINEAVFLGDKVVVLSPHPGEVKTVFENDLPRPRTDEIKETDRYYENVKEVRRCLVEA